MDREPVNEKARLAYLKAFCALQADLEDPVKEAENPHFRSRYVSLQSLLSSLRPVLSKHGFCLQQLIKPMNADGSRMCVETLLVHVDGHGESSEVPIITDKPGPQALGSAITYARRYGAGSLLPIAGADEDDDGEQAEGRSSHRAPVSSPFDLIEEAMASARAIKTNRELQYWAGRVAASKFTGDDKTEATRIYRETQKRITQGAETA